MASTAPLDQNDNALTEFITSSFNSAVEAALNIAANTVLSIQTAKTTSGLKEQIFYLGHFLIKFDEYGDVLQPSHLQRLANFIVVDWTPKEIDPSELEDVSELEEVIEANTLAKRAIRAIYRGKVGYWEMLASPDIVETFFAIAVPEDPRFDENIDEDITWQNQMTESIRDNIDEKCRTLRTCVLGNGQSAALIDIDFLEGLGFRDEATFHVIGNLYFYVLGSREGDIAMYI